MGNNKTSVIQIKIQNIVATTDINQLTNLTFLYKNLKGSDYNPEEFPGLIYKNENLKMTFLIFSSGKIVILGAKSMDNLYASLNFIKDLFREKITSELNLSITNIVGTCDLKNYFNLEKVYKILLDHKIFYNFESPRSLVYYLNEPKSVIFLSKQGKITSVGTKSLDDLYNSIKNFTIILKQRDIIERDIDLQMG